MLEELKQQVCAANLSLAASGLVIDTWGNVSGIDRASGNIIIKPSGLPYEGMGPQHMVVVSLETGQVVEGELKPSSDTPAHLEIYRAFAGVGGVVHTHSLCATAWAQARREIPAIGTTHADYFYGPVPCTRMLTAEEIQHNYESHIGKVIVERFAELNPLHLPAVLAAGHGPFAWGGTPAKAVHSAIVLEHLAKLASETLRIEPYPIPLPQELLDKHFLRKNGPNRYYGQKE